MGAMLRAPSLGRLLLDVGVLTQKALDEVLAAQKTDKRRLGDLLVEKKLVRPDQLAQVLSHQLSCPWVSLARAEIAPNVLALIPKHVAEEFHCVPVHLRVVNGVKTLYVATDDPTDEDALAECAFAAAMKVRFMVAITAEVDGVLSKFYGAGQAEPPMTVPNKPPLPSSTGAHARATLPDVPPSVVSPPSSQGVASSAHAPSTVPSTVKVPIGEARKKMPSIAEIDDAELVPSSSDEPPPAAPRHPPKIVTLNAPDRFLAECKEAASKLSAEVIDAQLINAANVLAEHHPCAVVVTEDVYAFDRAGLNRLALDVDAVLVVWSDDVEGKQLAPLLEGAVKRWLRSSYEKGTFVEGKYELLRDLGGTVAGSRWEVRHARTLRRSVLKVGVHSKDDEADADAVQREQNALSRVHHPAAVDLRDAGKTDLGDPFIVVELVEGRTMEGLVAARERLPSWDVCSVYHQIADCLCAAHTGGVTHGAVKPEHVVVIRDGYGSERAKLINWESAIAMGGAPRAAEAEADVRAVGGCLFHALVGRKRNDDEDVGAALAEAGVGPTLATVVERAMSTESDRFANMKALVAALEKAEPRSRDATHLLDASVRERRNSAATMPALGAAAAAAKAIVAAGASPALAAAMAAAATEPQSSRTYAQRRHVRAPYRTPVRIEIAGAGAVDGRSEDISQGGMFVVTRAPIKEGTKVVLRFALPIDGRIISEGGIVRWARLAAVGIELESPAPETQRQVERYVSLMAEEKAVPPRRASEMPPQNA